MTEPPLLVLLMRLQLHCHKHSAQYKHSTGNSMRRFCLSEHDGNYLEGAGKPEPPLSQIVEYVTT